MAILIDEARWRGRTGIRFAHVVSDSSFDELHTFVAGLETPRPLRFHRDHYDVPESLWSTAVASGATVVPTREIVLALRRAGLRTRAATSAGSGRLRRSG